MAMAMAMVLLCLANAQTYSVIDLNNKNFEHLTQAATGATTGDWFVYFYANWCSHCAALHEIWDDLAEELGGEVNVAKANAETEKQVSTRFKISKYPTLLYFHHGEYYRYTGSHDLDSLVTFAREVLDGVAKAQPQPVPKEQTFIDSMLQDPDSFLYKVSQLPWHLSLSAIVVGSLVGFGLVMYCLAPRGELSDFDHWFDFIEKSQERAAESSDANANPPPSSVATNSGNPLNELKSRKAKACTDSTTPREDKRHSTSTPLQTKKTQ